MLDLKFRFKTVWDRDRFQPINESAKFLSKLIARETLSKNHLLICKEFGCTIDVANIDIEKYLSEDYQV